MLGSTLDRWLAIALLLGQQPAPAASGTAAAARSASALAAQATRLYRAKQYQAACPLFRQVTELAPTRGAAFGDYGLCLARLGQRQAALTATYEAVLRSSSDVKSRRAAYYNLGTILGQTFPSHVPGPTEEGPLAELEGPLARCEIFDPVPGCDRRAWGCFASYGGGLELGRFARDPRTIASKDFPRSNDWDDPQVLLDRDVLVLSDGYTEYSRAGPSSCRFSVACRVVWADACAGHIGYVCDVAVGPSAGEVSSEGDEPCVRRPTFAGEIKLP